MTHPQQEKRPLKRNDIRRLMEPRGIPWPWSWPGNIRGADLAAFFERLSADEKTEIFHRITEGDREFAAELLSYLGEQDERDILETLPAEKVARLVEDLSDDDAVAVFTHLRDDRAQEIFLHLKHPQVERMSKLLMFPKDSAGRRMIPQFAALPAEATVQEAIDYIRQLQEHEMIYYLYVVDGSGVLKGVLSMRQLLLAAHDEKIGDIMSRQIVKVNASDDQEDAAHTVTQYGLMAIPVVDNNDRLLGIITVDDIVDVLHEEATEDILRLAGTNEDAMLTRSVRVSLRHRLPWLIATFIGGIAISLLIGRFEGVISKIAIAAAFMPIIAGMGGNVGTQSATIVIRGIALGHLKARHIGQVLWREIRVSGTLGIIYGALLAIFSYMLKLPHPMLGVVVGLSLLFSITMAGMLGAFFPLLFSRLGFDPAVATGPFVTTLVDFMSNAVYFTFIVLFLIPGE